MVYFSKDSTLLHLLKTISYRILGTLFTFLLTYFLIGDVTLSAGISLGEFLFKPLLYFFHEKLWAKLIK